jgi:hypothetical protein
METLGKRNFLQEVVDESGHPGWYVIEASTFNRATYRLFNPKEKKMGEVSIPDEWIDDPRRHSTIAKSLALTILLAVPFLPFPSRLSHA